MTPDIEARIATNFDNAHREEARDILRRLDEELREGEHARILRCVLFLSGGDMELLVYYSDRASSDWRDVIYWAEYDEQDHRLRDFNQPLPEFS